MKVVTALTIASSLFVSAAYADGFGFEVGPFNMGFRSSDRHYYRSDDGQYYRASDGRYYRQSDRQYYESDDPRYRPADEYRYDSSRDDYATVRTVLDTPICRAISNQKTLEISVEAIVDVSATEKKILTKKLIVEPYAFGVTNDGDPILHGTVTSEKTVKEISLRAGDPRFNEQSETSQGDSGTFFSGRFISTKNKNIDIRKVVGIRVMEDSHFDVPAGYKGMDDSTVRVICQLPVSK